MYFPVGWPKYLSVGQGRKSCLKSVVCNRYRMLFAVLTETTVSIWHCRPCVEIVCYQRCHSSVAAVGTNELAEWRQDSSMLAVTTTDGYLLLYQLEQDVKGERGLNLYEYHQTKTNQGDSNEAVPALRLTLKANVNYKVSITSLSCVHDDLLVTLKDGRLELLSWESPSNGRKAIGLCDILFSVDMQLAGLHLKAKHVYAVQAVYSPFLEGFAVVLSDGRAALVAMSQADTKAAEDDTDPVRWNTKGIWAPALNQATCVAVNNKYRLLAFGTEKGDCCVYAVDDVTGCLVLSHTIALSPTHYPTVCKSVGSVLNIDWSPDGCALSLSWASGGLSIWSVFGACLVCTLASDRAYASDGSSNMQGIFRSMCWGVEGYHLWLITESLSSSPTSSEKTGSEQSDDKTSAEKVPDLQVQPGENKSKKLHKRFRKKSTSSNDTKSGQIDLGQLLQIEFAKSALAMNPCMSNHCHVLMHREDRIYLSSGERQFKSLVLPEKLNSLKKQVLSSHSLSENRQPLNKGNTSPRRQSVPASPKAFSSSSSLASLNGKLPLVSEEADLDEEEEVIEEYVGSPVGNKQWTVIQFPLNYLPSNWPIRFAAVDETCCFLAIAGNFGLAHYTVISRKWKVFGNVMQEKDMVVTGGLTWWEDFIVVACFNLSENQDEIRLYPRLTNLDNAFACIKKVRSQILLVNVFQNLLILFTYDCRISIFVIARDAKAQRPMATLRFLQDISMARFVPYPTLVASVTMSALHMESATRRSSSSTYLSMRPPRETEVIIVNVAGRLLLLQRSIEEDDAVAGALSEEELINPADEERKQMRFTSPVVLASCVENIWTTQHKNRAKVHLTDALWLGCGGAGIRVWLPLFPPKQSRHNSSDGPAHRGFELQLLTARRITLAFSLDNCYPLSVLFSEAVILGVTSEVLLYQEYDQRQISKRNNSKSSASLPYSTMERTCEIYLHQILRQLLRRNLGYHALQLAATCNNLSCFPHVLELMLHEVLEEEATASEPIPDPLLPTVIKFLEEFPEYLQTVVHCARKTEIALWEYLFNSVGSPRELFEECLKTNQLQTAASYLIILQNLEQLSVARQDATRLFDQALQNQMWELSNDIARFLRAIGDGDASATPRHPTLLNTNIYPAVAPASIHNTPTEPEPAFKFSEERKKSTVMRQYSMAPSYYEKALAPAAAASCSSFGKENQTNGANSRKLTASRSCPSTPAVVVTYHGNTTSGANSSPDDFGTTPTNHANRRLATRSYTESFLLPAKSPNSAGTITSPVGQGSTSSSMSQPFVPRYSMRQYQDPHTHRPLHQSLSHPVGGSSGKSKRLSNDKDILHAKEHAAAECAEHYFIDVILARQARKMLSEKQLHRLGTFAAYIDFQLVPWLRKERNRAARVEDPIASFKSLHSDFDWPFPAFFPPKSTRSSNSSGGAPSHSHSFNDLQTLQNRVASLSLNTLSPSKSSNFNSSTSPGNRGSKSSIPLGLSPKRFPIATENGGFGADEDGGSGSGILTMLSARETGSTLTLTTVASEMSEISESSYTLDDSSFAATTEDVHGFVSGALEVDDRRGPARSEMKLQYLLELFLEALCLEWAALICIMLKDSSYMARLVRSARSSSQSWMQEEELVSLGTLQRTRACLQQVDQWAMSECPGYKAVLINMRTHLLDFYDVINAREIAHAEKQAIIATQQRSGSSGQPSINTATVTGSGERVCKSSHTSTTTTTTSTSPQTSVAKKRLFSPGTAILESQLKDNAVNGGADSSPSTPEDDADKRDGAGRHNFNKSDKLESSESTRTRHNSVPCKPNAPGSETVHSRTPSSPAKINLSNSISNNQDGGGASSDGAVASIPVETGLERSRDLSQSGNSEEDLSEYSGSEDDDVEDEEASGCAVS